MARTAAVPLDTTRVPAAASTAGKGGVAALASEWLSRFQRSVGEITITPCKEQIQKQTHPSLLETQSKIMPSLLYLEEPFCPAAVTRVCEESQDANYQMAMILLLRKYNILR